MVLTKELALKLLGGLGLVGTVAGTAIYLGQNQKKGEVDNVDVSLPTAGDSGQQKKEEEEVDDEPRTGTNEDGWLKCTGEDNNKECVLDKGEKMNIMVGDKKVTVEGPLELGDTKKIKSYRVTQTSGQGYSKDRKYVIEGGDIDLKRKKIPSLKNMEVYEVKEVEGNSYFVRSHTSGEEKGNLAGFPEGCVPPEEGTVHCKGIAEEKLKDILFKNRTAGKFPKILNESKKIDIKITKVNENKEDYGYRVVFQSPEIIEIEGTGSIIPYTNTEFMFKPNTNSSVDVERVWDAKKLGEKVGLVCEVEANKKECTLETLNIFRGGKTLTGVKASGGKLTYEDNKEGYNQGFKFLVKETVTLEGNETLEDNYSYEIKEHGGNWFLYRKEH